MDLVYIYASSFPWNSEYIGGKQNENTLWRPIKKHATLKKSLHFRDKTCAILYIQFVCVYKHTHTFIHILNFII